MPSLLAIALRYFQVVLPQLSPGNRSTDLTALGISYEPDLMMCGM